MTYAYLQRRFRIYLRLACCFLWMVSAAAHAKMTIVTLSELIKKSEIIVYGHFNPLVRGASNQSPAVVLFEVESIFKGTVAVVVGIIPLCNLRDEYSDEYDLAKLTGVDILFVSKKGRCYELSHGDRSVVPVYGGGAHTIAIEDQPDEQPLEEFVGKIRTIVTASDPTASATLAAVATVTAVAGTDCPKHMPARVEVRLRPVLEALDHALNSDDIWDKKYASSFATLMDAKDLASSQARVALMDYYVGEAYAEELVCAVAIDGARSAKFLDLYDMCNIQPSYSPIPRDRSLPLRGIAKSMIRSGNPTTTCKGD
jgi:hypothetical protein